MRENFQKPSVSLMLHVYIFDMFNFTRNHYIQILTRNQPTITCSKLTKETLEKGVKYVRS